MAILNLENVGVNQKVFEMKNSLLETIIYDLTSFADLSSDDDFADGIDEVIDLVFSFSLNLKDNTLFEYSKYCGYKSAEGDLKTKILKEIECNLSELIEFIKDNMEFVTVDMVAGYYFAYEYIYGVWQYSKNLI